MPKLFQINQGDAGFSYNGANYQFTDVDTIQYTYNEKNHLTRGASGQNRVGIAYKEGLKTPDTAEIRVVDCSVAIYKLLLQLFKDATPLSVWFVDRKTGEGFTYKNAVIRDKPRQGEIAEGADAISFMFNVESFDVSEKINDE
jgi:hypothetical protein